jgi:hypothetical protein
MRSGSAAAHAVPRFRKRGYGLSAALGSLTGGAQHSAWGLESSWPACGDRGRRARDRARAGCEQPCPRRSAHGRRQEVRGVSGSDGDTSGRSRVIPCSRLGTISPARLRVVPGGGSGAADLLSGACGAARHARSAVRIATLTCRRCGMGVEGSRGLGIRHPSQVSRTLGRLERDGLAFNVRDRRSLNAWSLTQRGTEVLAEIPEAIYE